MKDLQNFNGDMGWKRILGRKDSIHKSKMTVYTKPKWVSLLFWSIDKELVGFYESSLKVRMRNDSEISAVSMVREHLFGSSRPDEKGK